MYLGDVLTQIEDIVENFIDTMESVPPGSVGLDPRACYGDLLICEDGVAVTKAGDRSLQYYGGVEYVDKEFRHELGSYVFYEAGAGRVSDVIEEWQSKYFDDEEEGE